MWPPVSLEHEGADWHVKDSITPSAINSWIGEEVRPVAAEGTLAATLGEHKLRATAAIMAANDTAGTLLTFRGWALHDRTTLAFRRQPLPPLDDEIGDYQAPFTHPLLDVAPRLRAPAGLLCEARLAAAGAGSLRAVPLRQSRRSGSRQRRPRMGLAHAVQPCRRWSPISARGAELKAQAMQGRTRMGFADGRAPLGRQPLPLGVRAADAGRSDRSALTARAEAFDTRNQRQRRRTTNMTRTAGRRCSPRKREWAHFTGLVELLHVSSRARGSRGARARAAAAPDAAPGRIANALVTMLASARRLPFARLILTRWCVEFLSCGWRSPAQRAACRGAACGARRRCRRDARCATPSSPSIPPARRRAPRAPAAAIVVSQKNLQFHPFLTIVPVGADVSFPNLDPTKHHVYSFSPAKRFELKLFAKDQSRTVHFDKPGVVALGCNIHDQMSAFIVVTDSAWTARTNAQGHGRLRRRARTRRAG